MSFSLLMTNHNHNTFKLSLFSRAKAVVHTSTLYQTSHLMVKQI